MNGRASLPDPDRAALERSARLRERVVAAATEAPGGVLAFDRFMALALYAPDLGYYAAGGEIFGAEGDFVTAPESGELYGACLARQCAEVLAAGGDTIVEYGAGSGRLAALLLGALLPRFPHLRYHIVEPSAGLRARQRARLAVAGAELAARVTWSATPPPLRAQGVVIANEVLDAMPARCYMVERGSAVELGVRAAGGGLAWARMATGTPPPEALASAVADRADGFRFEHLPELGPWCVGLREVLSAGIVLVADYGYPRHEILHPARHDGTLKCHYRHHVHDDPFFHPGVQDITVSVDFTSVAEAAHDNGWRVAGYVTQAGFLLACGLQQIMAERAGAGAAADYVLAQEAKRLLLPGEMGQVVKIMALALDYDAPLTAFGADERHRLGGFADAPQKQPGSASA